MSKALVLGVDGGNSKTHLAIVDADGAVRAFAAGGMSSPDHLGVDGAVAVLDELFERAAREAGIEPNARAVATAHLLVAGVDSEPEEEELRVAADARAWAKTIHVGNDTFAVLRAGTEEGWGVAVTCGAGINCVGVARDGRQARFPSLGWITGDWGGGYDVGVAAVVAAARSEDGRGPRTSLERAVPLHFGVDTPSELARAFHEGRIASARVGELPPIVLAEAADDAVARSIVERLGAEIATMAHVALERLGMLDTGAEVILGGGLLQSGDGFLSATVARTLREAGPALDVKLASSPPIVGAALLGLDELGADGDARERLRRELEAAVRQSAEPAEAARG